MSQIGLSGEGKNRVIELSFDESEANILRSVAEQLRDLISDWPDDPAAQRLFPAGYEDAEAQAEFSRFTRPGLAERKLAAANEVIATLNPVPDDLAAGAQAADERETIVARIPLDRALPWLTFFTDVRLVLAQRLEAEPDAEEAPLQHGIFEWAASLQAALVESLAEAQSGEA